MKYLEIVLIEWVDSMTVDTWHELKDLECDLKVVYAVGFLLHQDLEKYVLSVAYDPEVNSANSVMYIPKSVVKRVKVIDSVRMA